MLATPPPFSGPKSHRKPLQPKNQSNPTQPKPYKEASILDTSNKENVHPFSYSHSHSHSHSTPVIDEADTSLADELNTIREKLVRLKIEEERNEKLLKQRGLLLDMQMKEIVNRGELQKQLEVEVDRLYRLKEIKLACMSISRIKSLRDKEEERKGKQYQLKKSCIYIQGKEGQSEFTS